MSKIVDDVKSGLKGIRGAGDELRGNLLEATDQTFERDQNNPETLAREGKHRAIAEKGKQDISGADDMLARREWEHRSGAAHNRVPATAGRPTEHGHGGTAGAVPLNQQAPTTGRQGIISREEPSAPGTQPGVLPEQPYAAGRGAPPAPGTLAREMRKGPLLESRRLE
ncbi:Fc.00g115350.m01.CDS01 [Cosmosporella sp. VM-42]